QGLLGQRLVRAPQPDARLMDNRTINRRRKTRTTMPKLKCGLIQMNFKADVSMHPDQIRDIMIEAHLPYIEEAGQKGVQVLCFQEVFTQPYFCPSQDRKWYSAAEKIPDGHTTRLMQEQAKKHNMVIVVPIYEEAMPGVYYNTCAVIDADG